MPYPIVVPLVVVPPALDSDCLKAAIIARSISLGHTVVAALGDDAELEPDAGRINRSTKSRHICCAPASS